MQVNDAGRCAEDLAKEVSVFQKLQDVIEKEGQMYAHLVETEREKIR